MTDDPLDELGPVDFIIVEFPAGEKQLHRERRPRSCWLWPRPAASGSSTSSSWPRATTAPSRRWSSPISTISDRSRRSKRSSRSFWPRTMSSTWLQRWSRGVSPVSSSTRTSGPRRSRRRSVGPGASSLPTAASPPRPSSPPSRRTKPSRTKETDMPLRAGRRGRVGVVGAPVAKTADVARPSPPVRRRWRKPPWSVLRAPWAFPRGQGRRGRCRSHPWPSPSPDLTPRLLVGTGPFAPCTIPTPMGPPCPAPWHGAGSGGGQGRARRAVLRRVAPGVGGRPGGALPARDPPGHPRRRLLAVATAGVGADPGRGRDGGDRPPRAARGPAGQRHGPPGRTARLPASGPRGPAGRALPAREPADPPGRAPRPARRGPGSGQLAVDGRGRPGLRQLRGAAGRPAGRPAGPAGPGAGPRPRPPTRGGPGPLRGAPGRGGPGRHRP